VDSEADNNSRELLTKWVVARKMVPAYRAKGKAMLWHSICKILALK
jgi:hypothetical protein